MGQRITDTEARSFLAVKGYELIGPYESARAKATLRCANGHEFQGTYNKIQQGGGCPFCFARNTPLTRKKVEGLLSPRNIRLTGPLVGSRERADFECQICGHSWAAQLSSVLHKCGCPPCGKRRASNALRKPESEFHAVLEKFGFKMCSEYVDTKTHVSLECDEGHVWSVAPTQIIHRHTGCPTCSRVAAGDRLRGVTDRFANAMHDAEIEMTGPYFGMHEKTYFRCMDGHSWQATPAKISIGRGCPTCAKSGFDQTKPALVYVIELFDALTNKTYVKVGITNQSIRERFRGLKSTTCIKKVLRKDWHQIGRDAQIIETEIKQMWAQWKTTDTGFMGRAGGETECFEPEVWAK